MSRIGTIANATMAMMETNRISGQSADRCAAERAEREIEQKREAIAEKLEASQSSLFGNIFGAVLSVAGIAMGIVAQGLGSIGAAFAGCTEACRTIDKAATVLQFGAELTKAAAPLATAPFQGASGLEQAESSRLELAAEQESRARESAERRSERAREENQQAAATLIEQLSEYHKAGRFV